MSFLFESGRHILISFPSTVYALNTAYIIARLSTLMQTLTGVETDQVVSHLH
jgi:hypothetical protein